MITAECCQMLYTLMCLLYVRMRLKSSTDYTAGQTSA